MSLFAMRKKSTRALNKLEQKLVNDFFADNMKMFRGIGTEAADFIRDYLSSYESKNMGREFNKVYGEVVAEYKKRVAQGDKEYGRITANTLHKVFVSVRPGDDSLFSTAGIIPKIIELLENNRQNNACMAILAKIKKDSGFIDKVIDYHGLTPPVEYKIVKEVNAKDYDINTYAEHMLLEASAAAMGVTLDDLYKYNGGDVDEFLNTLQKSKPLEMKVEKPEVSNFKGVMDYDERKLADTLKLMGYKPLDISDVFTYYASRAKEIFQQKKDMMGEISSEPDAIKKQNIIFYGPGGKQRDMASSLLTVINSIGVKGSLYMMNLIKVARALTKVQF